MSDLSPVIVPKSDQLNADDLIAGPRTITITEVRVTPGAEQPVAIHFEGDNGKPWKPCKSMVRLMVAAWCPDSSTYRGKRVTLYRDPTVKWAGMAVGGIRISALSGISEPLEMALTETKGRRKIAVVRPLADLPPAPQPAPAHTPSRERAMNWARGHIAGMADAADLAAYRAVAAKALAKLGKDFPDLLAEIDKAYAAQERHRAQQGEAGEADHDGAAA